MSSSEELQTDWRYCGFHRLSDFSVDALRATLLHDLRRAGLPENAVDILFRGKMLRAQLFHCIYQRLHIEDAVINCFLKSIECLHEASLCHDDIQDHQKNRRGRPTLWREVGVEQAISIGDFLLNRASLYLHELPDKKIRPALYQLNVCVEDMLSGQMRERALTGKQFKSNDLDMIVRKKTISLLQLGLQYISDLLPDEQQKQLILFMHHFGFAYQLHNDLFGWSFTEQCPDLVNRVPNAVVLKFFDRACGAEEERLIEWWAESGDCRFEWAEQLFPEIAGSVYAQIEEHGRHWRNAFLRTFPNGHPIVEELRPLFLTPWQREVM